MLCLKWLLSFVTVPNPFRLPPHSRGLRVFELKPIRRAAGPVARAEPFGHDALGSKRAGVVKNDMTVRMLKVFIEAHSWPALA